MTPTSFGDSRELFAFLPNDQVETERLTWFLTIVQNNPSRVTHLEGRITQLRRQGRKRYGIRKLLEDFRWETPKTAGDKTKRKCSNDLNSLAARYMIREHPELATFFRRRPMGSKAGEHTTCSNCGVHGPAQAAYCWRCGSKVAA